MIQRFYLTHLHTFDCVNLEFDKGLVVFTGPSGAGKSVLMESFLSLFGYKNSLSDLCEVTLEGVRITDPVFDTSSDDITIKAIKKEKVRYFFNEQSISKKRLQTVLSPWVKHLHTNNKSDFESDVIIAFLDRVCSRVSESFHDTLKEFKALFQQFKEIDKRLVVLIEEESKLEELKAYARYEIDQISAIDPKQGEYEELNRLKKRLSKKHKIEEHLKKASPIFEYTHSVHQVLELMEIDGNFFDESMNELLNIFESYSDSLTELEEMDVESVLDRIEKLVGLQKRFGSIEEALNYLEKKREELKSYETIDSQKDQLLKEKESLSKRLLGLSSELTLCRSQQIIELQKRTNDYLEQLYLSDVSIHLRSKPLDQLGEDRVEFSLNKTPLEKISSGEFNRLRLALLTAMSEQDMQQGGVLFLDEIDANLSGKESNAMANVLVQLSKQYQIFAISHQPQLTASATQHILVDKSGGTSTVKSLNSEEKINEIARMISGEDITPEAIEFAKNLLN